MNKELRRRQASGFTMLETIIVVAITAILLGVGFAGILSMRKSMLQTELDATAKELFIAAQNQLLTAKNRGLLDTYIPEPSSTDSAELARLGTKEDSTKEWNNDNDAVFYFAYKPVEGSNHNEPDKSTLLGVMLPYGSIDEAIRNGGSYIIRYQPSTAKVLDVFFAYADDRQNGVFLNKGYDFTKPGNYDPDWFIGNEEGKTSGGTPALKKDSDARKNLGENHDVVIGYYGGEGDGSAQLTFAAPSLKVENGDVLRVRVQNPQENLNRIVKYNAQHPNANAKIKIALFVEDDAKESNAVMFFDLSDHTGDGQLYDLNTKSDLWNQFGVEVGPAAQNISFGVPLDDVIKETSTNKTFNKLVTERVNKDKAKGSFTMGGNLRIYAWVTSENVVANVASSSIAVVNNIFANGSKLDAEANQYNARVGSFRHLYNLQDAKSKYITGDSNPSGHNVGIETTESKSVGTIAINATQITDLDWNSFRTNTGATELTPVKPERAITYQGDAHRISNVVVGKTKVINEDAGLFGQLISGTSINNLEIVDASVVSANASAGALAGISNGATISNVLVRNTANKDELGITGKTAAGGLVGSTMGGSIEKSAAAVYVKATDGDAGGLIGKSKGTAVNASYAGGHTNEMKYGTSVTDGDKGRINVLATGNAGGLVGSTAGNDANTNKITNCYATASAGGTTAGTNVGGLVGASSGGKIENSYATGLVAIQVAEGTTITGGKGAFIGNLTGGTAVGPINENKVFNQYLEITNFSSNKDAKVQQVAHINGATPNADAEPNTQITAGDKDVTSYNAFAPTTAGAQTYDSDLDAAFNHKYPYRSIQNLVGLADEQIGAGKGKLTSHLTKHYGDWGNYETFVVNTQQ